MKSKWTRTACVMSMAVILNFAGQRAANADEVWQSLAGGMSASAGQAILVNALMTYNGDLIAGGSFTSAGGVAVNHIGRWNGSAWQSLGGGMGAFSVVNALTVYNGDLIVGGGFSTAGGMPANCIARWNGSTWQPLGNGMVQQVSALTVYNGELIAGGMFTAASGVSANYIARWNGSTWQPLGSGTSERVNALTVYNGQLIAGGFFTSAGGVSANRVARWDGASWQSLGSGVTGEVRALGMYNNELIVGGDFFSAGAVPANRIARWNGLSWQSLGNGVNGSVRALHVYNGELITGGLFTSASNVAANRIARWNGANWQPPLGTGFDDWVFSLTTWNGALVAGGIFTVAGGQTVNQVALTTANSTTASCELWEQLGSGITGGQALVYALTGYNQELIVGGSFTMAGGMAANNIARWNGLAWQPLGGGVTDPFLAPYVYALTIFDNELIAGGTFATAGGVTVNSIARWNGSLWQALGSGMNSHVHALTLYNGELIAGGFFTTAGGTPVNRVARWNGLLWQPLGSGMNSRVDALTVYNGELIAGGNFTMAGGGQANRIARWDGSVWQPLGSGMNNTVSALTVYNGALIAGGWFTSAGGVPVNRIAQWDGSNWQSVGTGVSDPIFLPRVFGLTVYNGELIAGGIFANAGGVAANFIARWNGSNWRSLGSGISGSEGLNTSLSALAEYNNELIAGGNFLFPGSRIARWHPNEWLASDSGLFIDNLNWDLGYSPGSPTSFGTIPGVNPFNVTFGAAAQSSALCITNQRPVFDLDGFQYSITNYTTVGGTQTAQLTVNNGVLNSPIVAVGSFGTLAGDGQINGNIFNVGTVRPGSSPTTPDVLTVQGNYEQPFGIFHAMINSAQHSRLDVGVQATLAGTLRVDLVGDPRIQLGQTFPIMTCGVARVGQFEAALLPDIGQNLVMNVQYDPLNDGTPQLVGGGGGVTIVVGTPSGSPDFGEPEIFGLAGEPTGIVSASIGASLASDLALSVAAPSPSQPGNALILLNQGDGSSFSPVVVAVGREPSGLVAADLSGGLGDDDIAVANRGDDNITVLFHQGLGVFNSLTVPVGESPSAIAAGDLRGLGLIDLAVANQGDNSITLLLNDGAGGFSPMTIPNVGSQPAGIAVAQLAGDSLPDLVVANSTGNSVTVLVNQGNTVFLAMAQLPVGQGPSTIDPADVDNDRDLDLVVANGIGGSFSVLLSQGTGQFGQAITLPMQGSPLSLSSWDMDTDGDVDLVAVINDDQLGPVIRVLRNDLQSSGGPLAFTLFDPIGQGEEPRLVRGADVTGDLSQDMVAVNVSASALAGGVSSALAIRPNLIAEVPGDIAPPGGDGVVNVQDLLAVIGAWGACPGQCPPYCEADLAPEGGNCVVNVQDLLFVIANWG